jgi:hypothetical protein
MSDNGNLSAFGQFKKTGEIEFKDGGLTKREYFTVEVMKAFIRGHGNGWRFETDEELVNHSVSIADMLLKELETPKQQDDRINDKTLP